MASPAQINANRLNAQSSTGPRTAVGKIASSRNAIRHNLSPGATFTLLPGEDVAAFEQLVRDYRDEFNPGTAHELFLVNQMIQAQWRISRIERLQAELLDKILNAPMADGKSDEAAMVAVIGLAQGDALDKLERYGRSAERAYFRANKELKQYRAEKQNEPKPALSSSRPPVGRNEAKFHLSIPFLQAPDTSESAQPIAPLSRNTDTEPNEALTGADSVTTAEVAISCRTSS